MSSVAWSPDGKRILPGAGQDSEGVGRRYGEGIAPLVRPQPLQFFSVAWSPDGTRAGHGERGIRPRWCGTLATGKELLRLSGQSDSVLSVAGALDGKLLAHGERG